MSQVKLILREDVPKLGDAGDLVNVKPGYARNYLIPQGLASLATVARMKEVEHHARVIAERQAKLLKDLKGTAKLIRDMDLRFEVQVGEGGKLFGSVTAAQIAERIQEQGLELDRRRIQINTIKQVGEHDVAIRLHKDLTVDVKVQVVSSGAAPAEALPDEVDDGEEKVVFGGAEADDHGADDE